MIESSTPYALTQLQVQLADAYAPREALAHTGPDGDGKYSSYGTVAPAPRSFASLDVRSNFRPNEQHTSIGMVGASRDPAGRD